MSRGNEVSCLLCSLLLQILKNVIREEKHISYLITDEEEEFLFICGCITDLQVRDRTNRLYRWCYNTVTSADEDKLQNNLQT